MPIGERYIKISVYNATNYTKKSETEVPIFYRKSRSGFTITSYDQYIGKQTKFIYK
jgi:hypothetical protein